MVNTWDQKVMTLPNFECLHIGGWGMIFYEQRCYMFKGTHQVKHTKRLAATSANNNHTHTIEAANLFPNCRKRNSCQLLSKWGHPTSGRARICCWSVSHTCFIKYKSGEGSGQSIHYILFALNVLIDHPSLV